MTFSHQQCRLPRGRVASVRVGNAFWGLRAVSEGHVCARVGGRPRHALKLLATWMVFIRTVLKHGPKECNMRASLGRGKPVGTMKVKVGIGLTVARASLGGHIVGPIPGLRCSGI